MLIEHQHCHSYTGTIALAQLALAYQLPWHTDFGKSAPARKHWQRWRWRLRTGTLASLALVTSSSGVNIRNPDIQTTELKTNCSRKSVFNLLDKRIAARPERIAKLTARIAKLTARIAKLTAIIAKLATWIAKLTTRIAKLTARIAKLTARIAKLTARIAKLTARIAKLAAWIARPAFNVNCRSS